MECVTGSQINQLKVLRDKRASASEIFHVEGIEQGEFPCWKEKRSKDRFRSPWLENLPSFQIDSQDDEPRTVLVEGCRIECEVVPSLRHWVSRQKFRPIILKQS